VVTDSSRASRLRERRGRSSAAAVHDRWMSRCRTLARQARRHGEAAVGSVIVRRGRLLAEAAEAVKTLCDPTAHAELLAIRAACQRLGSLELADSVLYTTAEPCWMCAYAIRRTGIGKVVIARPVPTVGGISSAHPILTLPLPDPWPPPPVVVWWRRR